MRQGHVPWNAWQGWGIQDTAKEATKVPWLHNGDEGVNMKDFGPLARSVAWDLDRLRISLRHVDPQRDVTQTIRNIRIHWPQEYLQHTDDADE
jgi:hypothetical protein